MKIVTHPRIQNITVGDEVYSHTNQLHAHVTAIFPAAVCVRVGTLALNSYLELVMTPQLWGAEDIENLSICRHCGNRDELHVVHDTGIPFRICTNCRAWANTPHDHRSASLEDSESP
jgi:hypothetical protein